MSHNPALDGLRGIAIVLVMFSHAHVPWMHWGMLGVDLFFVLSGYLITHSLVLEIRRTGRIDFWRFYQRRFYRLTPALLLFLFTYCLAAPFLWPDYSADWYTDALVSALYLADYGIAFFDNPSSLLHMWSLSVEEHFYLLWPVLLLWLARRRLTAGLLWPLAGLFVLAWAWRVLWVVQGQAFYEIFFRFDTRASGLLLGCVLAVLMIERPTWLAWLQQRAHHGLWLLLAMPWVVALKWDDMGVLTLAMTWTELLTVALILLVQPEGGRLRAFLSQPWLVWVGKLSYGVYLWHYPIYRLLRERLDWPWVMVLGTLLSLLLAWGSWMTVERWGLRLRDRHAARSLTAPIPAPVR